MKVSPRMTDKASIFCGHPSRGVGGMVVVVVVAAVVVVVVTRGVTAM